MNCRKLNELASDFIDGTLASQTCERIAEHLKACPECESLVAETRRMVEGLRGLCVGSATCDCWAGVREKILCAEIERKPWTYFLLKPMVAAPALAVGALAVVLALVPLQPNEPVGRDPAAVPGYSAYVSAHSRAQQQQVFSDHDVVFVTAELERAGFMNGPDRR